MKMVIATALYPPDVAAPAPYIKELAKRLGEKHEIVVVTYGHLPEKIPGISFESVDKRNPLIIRLLQFTFKLLSKVRNADVFYVENGASVELPAIIVSLLTLKKYVFHIGDKNAHALAKENILFSILQTLASWRAKKVFHDVPMHRPEFFPFEEYPEEKFREFEASWKKHLHALANTFL